MKMNKLYPIVSLLLVLLFVSSCGNKLTTEKKLENNINAIEKLAKQSKNVKNADDAFQLLRSFNKHLSVVKNSIMSLEEKFLKAPDDKKEAIKKVFDDANIKLKSSAATIYSSIEPFKNDPNVKDMLTKINGVLISQ